MQVQSVISTLIFRLTRKQRADKKISDVAGLRPIVEKHCSDPNCGQLEHYTTQEQLSNIKTNRFDQGSVSHNICKHCHFHPFFTKFICLF